MSAGDREIICRRCNETISRETGNCPHCGASIRSRRGPVAMVVVGLVIMGGTVPQLGSLWFFTLIGLFLVFGGGYLLYDRRRRIREAGSAGAT